MLSARQWRINEGAVTQGVLLPVATFAIDQACVVV
jgi:hypothetical protein